MFDEPRQAAGSALAAHFRQFTPQLLVDRQLVCDPQVPRSARFPAAALVADLTGFTSLTETLVARSREGAEEVQALLNAWFGPMTEEVYRWGGQVLHFSGDAVLALWPCEAFDDLPVATARARQCGRAMLATIERYDATQGFRPELRIAISAGEVWAGVVGGTDDRWELLAAGSAIEGLSEPFARAVPGEVAASASASVALEHSGPSQPPSSAQSTPWLAPDLNRLKLFVPRALRARLEAGHDAWLAELRRISVAFINLTGLDYGAVDVLDRAHGSMRLVQSAVYQLGGSINQILVDEKGTTVVAVWGLALGANEDDPARATVAALRLTGNLESVRLGCRIGIATGLTFTGHRGGAARCEYAVIGDAVNLAARLMERAEPILCDASTQAAAGARVRFQPGEALRVKGKLQPVSAARPFAEQPPGRDSAQLIGRRAERRLLADRLRALEQDRTGGVVFIEGEPGIGKTALVRSALEDIEGSGIRSFIGRADAIERSTPYFIWRVPLARALGIDHLADASRRQKVLEHGGAIDGFAERAALLNSALACDFESSPLVESMPPRARGDAARELLVRLLKAFLQDRPLVVVLDDVHWMDSASWALTLEVRKQVAPLLLIIVSRTTSGDVPEADFALRMASEAFRLELKELDAGETASLIRRRLNVVTVPPTIVRTIASKAGGHPLFVEQLAFSLRDRGLIRTEAGECRVAARDDQIESLDLPASIQQVITSRIDLLSIEEQFTLKVASVLGQRFASDGVAGIHPVTKNQGVIAENLQRMVSLDLLRRSESSGFEFRHAAVRDVAYGLLTRAQRRDLHRAAAERLEQSSGRTAEPAYAVLAHHWAAAEDRPKTMQSLERAGEAALWRSYANLEAVEFFTKLVDYVDLEPDPARQARWQRALGEAQANLGRHAVGCAHLEKSLDLLGWGMPESRGRLRRQLAIETAAQLVRRLPWRIRRRIGPDARVLEAVRAYSRLGAAFYVLDRRSEAVYALLRAANLAEPLGTTPELACAFADLGNVAGVVPAPRLARRYISLAKQMADAVDEPACSAHVLSRTSVYRRAVGDWDALSDLARAMQLCDRVGHHWQWAESATILAHAQLLRGELRAAYDLSDVIAARSDAHDVPIARSRALQIRAEAALRLGAVDESIEIAESGLARIGSDETDRHGFMQLQGTLASAWLRKHDLTRAARAADAVAQAFKRASVTSYGGFQGYIGVIEVHAALWRAGGVHAAAAAEKAGLFTRVYQQYARRCLVAQPSALRLAGVCEALRGRTDRAARLFRRSLGAARTFETRYDEAAALVELALHSSVDARRPLLTEARDLFLAIGAVGDADEADALIRSVPAVS